MYTTVHPSDPSREAEAYKERLEWALKAAKICVFEVDVPAQKYTFFANAEDIFGVSGEQILRDVAPYSELSSHEYQTSVSEYFAHPDDVDVIDRAFASIFRGQPTTYEARMRAGGSDYIWCKLDVTPIVEDGIPRRMIGVITDISKLKNQYEEIENEAKHDGLTGLYRGRYARRLMEQLLAQYPRQKHALVMLDVDNFKRVNDTFGHEEGDLVLRQAADTLRQVFGEPHIIDRFGGDEFIVLVRNFDTLESLHERLQRVAACVSPRQGCSASVGVAVFPDDGADYETLFRKADQALYASKLVKGVYTFAGGLGLK